MTRFARATGDPGVIAPRATSDTSGPGRSSRLARLIGAGSMLLLTLALFWLVSDDDFRLDGSDVTISGVRYADTEAVRAHIGGIDRFPNVFRIRAGDIVEDIGALPEVRFARASVSLPASITVEVIEREPILVWSHGGTAWLVDDAGVLFSPRSDETPPPTAETATPGDPTDGEVTAGRAEGAPTPAGLPRVEDERIVERAFASGDRLPPVDLAVMRQLLAVTPELLGSRAAAIALRIDDTDGYVLEAADLGWHAVFGHYRPMVQPPDVVPLQVQCLGSLIASRPEHRLDRVRLAVANGLCGTFRMVAAQAADP